MLFEGKNIPQAIKIPFNWCADYFDGTSFTEYDLRTHAPNNFYAIKQNETAKFGLFGQGMKMFFNMSDGSFMLNGRRVDIGYETDGKLYMLTSNFNNKDLITYKEAHTQYNNREGNQRSHINSINFGYKTLYQRDNIQFNFQAIVSLPAGESAFIEVKLTSNTDLNGELVFYTRNQERERFLAPLEKKVSGQIRWTIK